MAAGQAAEGSFCCDIPLELILVISEHLHLKDRVAFTSCCRCVWHRAAPSAALWGDLQLRPFHVWPSSKLPSLAAWLARRAGALRRVQLDLGGQQADPAQLFTSLGSSGRSTIGDGGSSGGGGLVELELSCSPAPAATLRALCQLSGLRRLSLEACGLLGLPQRLPASLERLRLSQNPGLGAASRAAGGGVFWALGRLTGLQALDLADCGLSDLPLEIGLLSPSLIELDFAGNWHLGTYSLVFPAFLYPLRRLTGLTRLSLARCALQTLPGSLTALTRLASLDLGRNWRLGTGDAGDAAGPLLGPLQQLTTLTQLDLSRCSLAGFQELTALGGLVDLRLAQNPLQERAYQPLRSFTALTRLDLSGSLKTCPRLPAELSALPALVDLRAGGNEFAWGSLSLAPLAPLLALTFLSLADCSLVAMPTRFPPLPALAELDLSGNPGLFERPHRGWAFRPLQQLRSLRRLRLARCSPAGRWQLPCPPEQLLALEASGVELALV